MIRFLTFPLFFFLLTLANGLSAQNPSDLSLRHQNEITAKKQINDLHNGALLVMLKTQTNKINALRKNGFIYEAEKIEKEQITYNLLVIKAFKKEFTFCPVYFFMSTSGPFVYDKKFDQVVFVNDKLLADSSIKFKGGPYFIGEFGEVEQDTIQTKGNNYPLPNENQSEDRASTYSGGSNFSFGALIIRSDKFYQLRKPFPFYVRTFDGFPISRSVETVVKKMNAKLLAFYETVKE